MVELNLVHWIYIVMVFIVLITLIMRKDIAIPCIIGVFLIGLAANLGVAGAVGGIFTSFMVSASELLNIIMVISIIVAMSKLLEELGASELMVRPMTKLIKTPDQAFWFIGIVMLITSWFFWPSPATPLIGAVLLPVAYKVGLPAMGAAMAINLFGHGIALSTDFVIQGAPTLTASTSHVDITEIMMGGLPLFAVMSIVTVTMAYIMLKRDMKRGILKASEVVENIDATPKEYKRTARLGAILVPCAFTLTIVAMFMLKLRGGSATALVGGTAVLVLVIICIAEYKTEALNEITKYIKEGFIFGMKIFGPIIPIAAFFYMGSMGSFVRVMGENVLPASSQGILADVGRQLAATVAMNKPTAAIMEMTVGVITGLDGSGFSGIALSGSMARVFGTAVNGSVAKLGVLGQIGAVWVGGGTIIPWSGLIAVAAISGVLPMDLARRNFIPVMTGLIVTTIVAMFLI
ncbi:conserved hypothetical protein [Alkaliphilus metalliredigens QYMF]|uniref:Transporter n=1 Tax=Alkaliphilus metalliredigens (strain QYMF) TaxID=293826 RepID=A6TLV2_ALKMQ|nr:hypothetical protein [Alkaliphilus metalliredigens]ABR47170.1 conserved hypothetical protein [Alkaliphilus metalliredigens QYMF]